MVGVFAYGSLLHPSEYSVMFPSAANDAVPVRLHGFERTFEQETTFRDAAGNGDATLTVYPSDKENSWVNGILLPNIEEQTLAEYRDREKGYDIREVSTDEFSVYEERDSNVLEGCESVLVPVGDLWVDDPKPVPEYLALAATGATLHGDKFLADFILTTKRVGSD